MPLKDVEYIREAKKGEKPHNVRVYDEDTRRQIDKRNYAMLALLIGFGLRRGELLALTMRSVHFREEDWAIADL